MHGAVADASQREGGARTGQRGAECTPSPSPSPGDRWNVSVSNRSNRHTNFDTQRRWIQCRIHSQRFVCMIPIHFSLDTAGDAMDQSGDS